MRLITASKIEMFLKFRKNEILQDFQEQYLPDGIRKSIPSSTFVSIYMSKAGLVFLYIINLKIRYNTILSWKKSSQQTTFNRTSERPNLNVDLV